MNKNAKELGSKFSSSRRAYTLGILFNTFCLRINALSVAKGFVMKMDALCDTGIGSLLNFGVLRFRDSAIKIFNSGNYLWMRQVEWPVLTWPRLAAFGWPPKTSRYSEPVVLEDCLSLNIPIIPKSAAPFVPITLMEPQAVVSANFFVHAPVANIAGP